ncbi:MAG: hypothetical protein ACRYFU_04970 [Janthinobacterium lividum]
MLRLFAVEDRLISERAYRRGLNLFFAYVGVVTLLYGLATARFYRSWTIADWLINYQGGFIRRGLPGELAFHLGRLLHLSPVVFVVAAYLVCYAALLLCLRRLALGAKACWWCLALVLSPATASFQVLDATGGFRKEVLYLAALALFVVLLQKDRLSPRGIVILLATAMGTEALSHESLVCYVPYFFAALYLNGFTLKQSFRLFCVPWLLCLVLALVASRHLGTLATAKDICGSLGYPLLAQGKQICSGGSIGYLAYSPEMARARTWTYVREDSYFLVYPLATALAVLPLVLGSLALAARGWKREIRLLWTVAAISFGSSIVLFVYAEDWGRWIYIHVLSLAILLLFLKGRRPQELRFAEKPLLPKQKRLLRWSLAAYATLWSLPHVPSRTLPFGYLGLAHYFQHYL